MKHLLIILALLSIAGSSFAETFGGPTDESGASNTGMTVARLNVHADHEYTASAGDVVTQFSVYGAADDGTGDTIFVTLYYENGSDTTLEDSIRIPLTTTDIQWWNSATVSISLTAGRNYFVGLGGEIGVFSMYYQTLTGGVANAVAAAIVDPFNRSGGSGIEMLVYATYTPGGAAAGQVIMIQTE